MDTNKPSMKLVEAQKLNENHFPLAAMWGQLIFLGSHVLGRKLNHHVDVSTYKLCNNFTKLMIRPNLHGRPKKKKKRSTPNLLTCPELKPNTEATRFLHLGQQFPSYFTSPFGKPSLIQ